MHIAQLLSQALDTARRAGYQVREESLDGAGGGHCLIRGKKCLLLDQTVAAMVHRFFPRL